MNTIRWRLIVIGALVVFSAVSLFLPRTAIVRMTDPDTGAVREDTIVRKGLRLGLDLRGGIHLALELDQSRGPVADPADALQRAERVIRTRVDELGVVEPVVQRVGTSRIVVQLPGVSDPERAKAVIRQTAFLEWRITDVQQQFQRARVDMDRALRAAGVRAPGQGPGGESPSAVSQLFQQDTSKRGGPDTLDLGQPGPLSALLYTCPTRQTPGEYCVPEEQRVLVDSLLKRPDVQRYMPRGLEYRWAAEPESFGARLYRALYIVEARPVITGEELVKAVARLDPVYNSAIVDFELTRRGGRIFERETARHVGDYMAIILDNRVQGPPPVIRSQIGQRGQIELSGKSLQEAQDLALVLRAGALPAPLQIVEDRSISASLGEDSIDQATVAGIVGVALVILIMIGYYRVSGALAVAALGFYCLFTLGALAGFGATVTLPGLAGFVLSIGIAVDANVLIFERIREELVHGKSVRLALDEGFRHAMNAIVDSNVSTVLTALFLFQFGTGPVKGFAVTLITGIAASMVTAIFVTRTFFMIWLQRRPAMQTLSI
jgi:preprotein translocase subunit SecD